MYIINGISKFRNEFYIIYLKFLAIYKKKDKKKKSYARNFSSGISPLAESIFIKDNMITCDTHVVYYGM